MNSWILNGLLAPNYPAFIELASIRIWRRIKSAP